MLLATGRNRGSARGQHRFLLPFVLSLLIVLRFNAFCRHKTRTYLHIIYILKRQISIDSYSWLAWALEEMGLKWNLPHNSSVVACGAYPEQRVPGAMPACVVRRVHIMVNVVHPKLGSSIARQVRDPGQLVDSNT